MKTFPLVVDDADEQYDRDEDVIASFPVLWDPRYQSDFRDAVRTAIERGREEIKRRHKNVKDAGYDVILTLERPRAGVHLRGDYRYSSEKMAEFLATTDYDLVPILVGKTEQGQHLLDGHHRWRAYEAAGFKPLVLSIQIQRSRTDRPLIIANVDNNSRTKTSQTNESLLRRLIHMQLLREMCKR